VRVKRHRVSSLAASNTLRYTTTGSRQPLSMDRTESDAAVSDTLGTQVRAVLAEALQVPIESIDLDAELDHTLGIDSLRLILVNIALEERYGVAMPEPGEVPLRSVADLVAFVRQRLEASAPA
jgi:acyl carrier protein